jgi:hypothetical protein
MTKIDMGSTSRIKGKRGPIFVGEAPNKDGLGLVVAYGEYFGPMCGRTAMWWYRRVRRVNLLASWPGRQGQGSAFPMAQAVEAAEALLPALAGQDVVCLGKRVARALGAPQAPYLAWRNLVWQTLGGIEARVAIFPHPSGINSWWNDERNRDQATLFMRRLLL